MEEKYIKDSGRNFNPLTSFLDKFKKILGESVLQKEIIIASLKKETGRSIEKQDIKISKNIVYINASPLFKNEILMRKEKILKYLKEENLNIVDIK